MKRMLLSFAIIAALAGFSLYGIFSVRHSGGELSKLLNQAIVYAEGGDSEASRRQAEEIEQFYTEHEEKLAFFLDRQLINDLGVSISQLYYLADAEDISEFCAQCRSADITVTHIMHSDNLTWGNVL